MALTDYVIMPGADYQALCDKIREKTGKTGAIRSGDLVAEVEEAASSGIELEGDILKYIAYQLDVEHNDLIICAIFFELFYKDTGNYNIHIPDKIGNYRVVINSEGVT